MKHLKLSLVPFLLLFSLSSFASSYYMSPGKQSSIKVRSITIYTVGFGAISIFRPFYTVFNDFEVITGRDFDYCGDYRESLLEILKFAYVNDFEFSAMPTSCLSSFEIFSSDKFASSHDISYEPAADFNVQFLSLYTAGVDSASPFGDFFAAFYNGEIITGADFDNCEDSYKESLLENLKFAYINDFEFRLRGAPSSCLSFDIFRSVPYPPEQIN